MSPSPSPEAHEAALSELLAEHAGTVALLDTHEIRCACGEIVGQSAVSHRRHLASVLLAAGWLPPETVTEARARELREAASDLLGYVPATTSVAAMQTWLRARADSLAPEAPSEEQR